MTAQFGLEEELSFDDYEFGLIDSLKKAIAGGITKTKRFLSRLSKAAKAKLQSAGKKAMATLKATKTSLTRSKQRLLKLRAKVARIPKLKAKYNILAKNQGMLKRRYRTQAVKASRAQKAGFAIPLLVPLAIGFIVSLGVEGIKALMALMNKAKEQEARIAELEEAAEEEEEEEEEEDYEEEEE